ncbi:MAG: putative cytokinetic ring protein SteA, partial [Armatimonadota bacterium]
MRIKGVVRLDKRTKNLAKRIKPGEIALIDHEDIDSVAANMLVESKVKAVINIAKSCSGKYPNLGPQILNEAAIPIIDSADPKLFDLITEGDQIEIKDGNIYSNGDLIGSGKILTTEDIQRLKEESSLHLGERLEEFAQNTLSYVNKEKSLILHPQDFPQIKTKINEKHVLVVVRGEGYKEDLQMIRTYIREVKPVLIGVDGGADALLEMGLKPHLIIGDMDSVSDKALKCGAEIIVHAYKDGRAPGLARVKELGLEPFVCAIPGTSEDLALLLAFEKGAKMIAAVGTHSNLIDFLDKGRAGMSSTFLVRLKVGNKLVDAKGVSRLYRAQPAMKYIWLLAFAAVTVILVAFSLSPTIQDRFEYLMDDMRSYYWNIYTHYR